MNSNRFDFRKTADNFGNFNKNNPYNNLNNTNSYAYDNNR
jgi:hypothetical protein